MAGVLREFVVDPDTFVATEGKAKPTQCLGQLWSTDSRPGGRRFVVYGVQDVKGVRKKVYDSDCCYDEGNAVNALVHWLSSQVEAKKAASMVMAA